MTTMVRIMASRQTGKHGTEALPISSRTKREWHELLKPTCTGTVVVTSSRKKTHTDLQDPILAHIGLRRHIKSTHYRNDVIIC